MKYAGLGKIVNRETNGYWTKNLRYLQVVFVLSDNLRW